MRRSSKRPRNLRSVWQAGHRPSARVENWAQCDRLVDQALDATGRLDVLVNNAGIAPLYPSLHEASEELFDKTLAVNLKGPFRLSARVARHMNESIGGS